jgi:hypothetical protein
MSVTAKVQGGRIILPPALNLPDGTEVEIIFPTVDSRDGLSRGVVRLPTFNGGGVAPGIDLEDPQAIRRLFDESGKLSQLP